MNLDFSALVRLLRYRLAQMRSLPSTVAHTPGDVEFRKPDQQTQVAPHKPAENHRLRSSHIE
jgi:hypothetical protein